MSKQYCYIIRIAGKSSSGEQPLAASAAGKNRTYVGYTIEPKRRIQQHNGILKGGAKATSISNNWQFLAIITSDSELFTKVLALSVEWHLKHPDNKKRTDVKYRGVDGKLRSIVEVLNRYSFDFNVYVDDSQKARLEELRNEEESKKDLSNPNCNVINIHSLNDFIL